MTQIQAKPCPRCDRAPKLLEGLSAASYVWYFRCESCGDAWAVPKTTPNAEPWIVVSRASAERVGASRSLGRASGAQN